MRFERRRQAILQQHLSDQQIYCLLNGLILKVWRYVSLCKGCNYLFIAWLKLNYVSKRSSGWHSDICRYRLVTLSRCGNKELTRLSSDCAPLAARTERKQGKFKLSIWIEYCVICFPIPYVHIRGLDWILTILLLWFCGRFCRALKTRSKDEEERTQQFSSTLEELTRGDAGSALDILLSTPQCLCNHYIVNILFCMQGCYREWTRRVILHVEWHILFLWIDFIQCA